MPVELTSQEISEKYNRFAPWYDFVEGIPDALGIKRLRRNLLRKASGTVLEVAVGTGKNLPYYPPGCQITAVDISEAMLERARRRAERLSLSVAFSLMDAEALSFPSRSFDTAVSTLTVCTLPNATAALQEMARVCKPNGRILLLEHGRSDREWLARWQDRRDDRHAKQLGCHWNREPLESVKRAGLTVTRAQRCFFGVFHLIEATPA